MRKVPGYERGRFFVSPILGCDARCYFCYIYDQGFSSIIQRNQFSIAETVELLRCHESFKFGREGSIISIGAWGDPFPRYDYSACLFSLSWLRALAELGNQIQIMSRYELHDEVVSVIADLNMYKGHILYSTSLTSVKQYKKVEPNADSPYRRMKSLSKLAKLGVATNVMIKPFVKGMTDYEVKPIAELLMSNGVEYCVVGDLLLDKRVKRIFSSVGLGAAVEESNRIQILDCSSGEGYEIGFSDSVENFIKLLSGYGLKVFRKSSCVNSYILNKPNPADYINNDPNGYCIKCGVCG